MRLARAKGANTNKTTPKTAATILGSKNGLFVQNPAVKTERPKTKNIALIPTTNAVQNAGQNGGRRFRDLLKPQIPTLMSAPSKNGKSKTPIIG
jgi:hypothetical protein